MVQRVGRVARRSPADAAGLRVSDRIVEMNGLNVETDSHYELMRKLAAAGCTLTLLVVDPHSDQFLHDLDLPFYSTQPFVEHGPVAQDSVDTDHDPDAGIINVTVQSINQSRIF